MCEDKKGVGETRTTLQLEHLLWVHTFYTDLVLSHFSTNFSLEMEKKKKGKLPENSEALVVTFQALFIRETHHQKHR